MVLVSGFRKLPSNVTIRNLDPINLEDIGGKKEMSIKSFENKFLNKGIAVANIL